MSTSVKRWIIAGTCLVGLAVIAIALSCVQRHAEERARATVLAEDTKAIRDVFAAYSKDHGHQPKCLDELFDSGYIKSIPREFLPKAKDLGLSEHCE